MAFGNFTPAFTLSAFRLSLLFPLFLLELHGSMMHHSTSQLVNAHLLICSEAQDVNGCLQKESSNTHISCNMFILGPLQYVCFSVKDPHYKQGFTVCDLLLQQDVIMTSEEPLQYVQYLISLKLHCNF